MANNVSSNFARKLLEQFLVDFEAKRVLSKAVNTQLFAGKLNPSSGTVIDVKRPHRYLATRSATGDLSSATNDIISGKAFATVQNYISVKIDYTNADEALKLNQLNEITGPAADELVTTLETSFASFMLANSGLAWGAPDTAVDAWSDIAGPMALMRSLGVVGECNYVMNPYVAAGLADAQNSLNGGKDSLVNMAWEEAQISNSFAGLKVFTSDALATYTNATMADMAGAVATAPTATYVGAKDTMTQSVQLSGLTGSVTIPAGAIIEFADTYYVNQKTRSTFVDGAGNAVKFRATVTADAVVDSTGDVTVVLSAPAIYESGGQYNTTESAIAQNEVATILGTTATQYQPNMFFHKDSFTITTVKLPKLYSTDSTVVTKDGIAIRVSKYSDGDKNEQSIRFDLLPAFGVMNPLMAGKGFGA